MLIIGIDPGISGSICFLNDGVIKDVIEMPSMPEGKKNKRQINGPQIFNEIQESLKAKKACEAGVRKKGKFLAIRAISIS